MSENRAEGRAGEATLIDLPCPRCGNNAILACLLTDERGRHQHTRYVCTFYGSAWTSPCDWRGWTVPGWAASGEDPK